MKTKLIRSTLQLFLEKRHIYVNPPEGRESGPVAPKSAQEVFKEIETAVKNLEQGKGEREELVAQLRGMLIDKDTRKYFSPELLTALAGHKEDEIREWVAVNPNTPVAILVKLAGDKAGFVMRAVAANRRTPANILDKLSNDHVFVKESFALNPATPVAVLVKLSGDDSEWGDMIRAGLAHNPSTPPNILAELAKTGSLTMRLFVAENRNTPPEILSKLAKDRNEEVRNVALANPNTPKNVK